MTKTHDKMTKIKNKTKSIKMKPNLKNLLIFNSK